MSVSYQYFRLKSLTGLGSFLEISEFQIVNAGTRIAGGTITASDVPDGGNVSDLNDNSLTTRPYWSAGTATNAGFWIKLDFGTAQTATGFKLGAFDTTDRYPSSCVVEGSNNGTTWDSIASPSGMPYPGNNTLSSEFSFSGPAVVLGGSAADTATAAGDLKVSFNGTPTRGVITFTGHQPGFISMQLGGNAADTVAAAADAKVKFSGTPARGVIAITGHAPGFINRTLTAIANHWISTHYLCVLTGSTDALPDLPLPISSFQTRMGADPFRVYLSVILPNADAYIAGINARPNGRLRVTRVYNYLDGSFQAYTMAEAPFDTITTNQGGKSGTTATLTGYENMAAITAQSVTLSDPITRSSSAGGRRYRCRIDPRIRPLDTAVINNESFLVDNVLHIIDAQTAIMEISEKL